VRRVWMLLRSPGTSVPDCTPESRAHDRYNGRIVPAEVLSGTQSMFVLYMAVFILSSLSLAWLGHDALTAISAVAATLGMWALVWERWDGRQFTPLSLTAKWICTFCMLVGRLEVYSVVVALLPGVLGGSRRRAWGQGTESGRGSDGTWTAERVGSPHNNGLGESSQAACFFRGRGLLIEMVGDADGHFASPE